MQVEAWIAVPEDFDPLRRPPSRLCNRLPPPATWARTNSRCPG